MAQPSGLPEPLTPAYVDLRNLPTMPLDVGRLRDSKIASAASGNEFQAAILLWCAAWHQIPAGSLPVDDVELAKLAGFGRVVDAWRAVKAGALYGWIRCTDGRLYHRYIASIVRERWEYRLDFEFSRYCDRARKANHAAKAKSLPEKEILSFQAWTEQEIARLSVEREQVSAGNSEEFQGNPAEIALKERKGKERKGKEIKTRGDARGGDAEKPPESQKPAEPLNASRGTRLPRDWVPTYSDVQAAIELQPTWNSDHVEKIAAEFRDYWIAVSGQRGTKLDWPATFRNWCRRSKPLGIQTGKVTLHDERKRASDALSGRDGS